MRIHVTSRLVMLAMGLTLCLLIGGPGVCRAEARAYPTPMGVADDSYRVQVGQADVPVMVTWKDRARIARFSMDGPTRVTLSTGEPIAGYEVRPRWAPVTAEVDGQTLTLTFEKPADVRVRINKKGPLALFGYPTYEKPAGEDVHGITDEPGIDATGKTNVTQVIQKAVDRISEAGGGTLHFPDGVYQGSKASTLYLKSNVRLDLAPGALIQQVRFVLNDVENVKLTGHGILDFTGSPGSNQAGCLRGNNAKNVLIEYLISLYFGYNWNTRFDHSQDVTIRNYKVFGGKDGINPVDSQRVHISHAYIITVDDCIATKSFSSKQGAAKEVAEITAEYCLLNCLKYGGVKIGTETNAGKFHDVVYRHIEMIGGMRAAIIQLRDGAEIHDITIEDLTAELAWGRSIDFVIQKRKGLGTIHDVTVKDVHLHNVGTREVSRIAGYDEEHQISDVTFEGLMIRGQPITSAQESGFEIKHAENIRFLPPKVWDRPIDGLGEMVVEKSEHWDSASEGGLAAMLDGNTDTRSVVRHEDRASFVIDLKDARKLSGLHVHAKTDAAGGVSVHLKGGEHWKPVLVRRLVANNGLTVLSFPPTDARQVRITLHGFPENDNIALHEVRLLERVETQ